MYTTSTVFRALLLSALTSSAAWAGPVEYTIVLESTGGGNVSAVGGGGGLVTLLNPAIPDWSVLTLTDLNGGDLMHTDEVTLRTYDGTHYLTAEGGGGGLVGASRTTAGDWETFTLFLYHGGDRIQSGDLVYLTTHNGRFMSHTAAVTLSATSWTKALVYSFVINVVDPLGPVLFDEPSGDANLAILPVFDTPRDMGCDGSARMRAATLLNPGDYGEGALAACQNTSLIVDGRALQVAFCEDVGGVITAIAPEVDPRCFPPSWGAYEVQGCEEGKRTLVSSMIDADNEFRATPVDVCHVMGGPLYEQNYWSGGPAHVCEAVGIGARGTWHLPDSTCGETPYVRPEGNVNWDAAAGYCESLNARLPPGDDRWSLCTRDQLCANGAPINGRPAGDVWAAVGDYTNAWVSIGTAYDERTCELHRDQFGDPAWGQTTGPQVITGSPAALRCCNPSYAAANGRQ